LKYTRPKIEIDVHEVPKDFKNFYWELFKKHHYLSEKLNLAARCYVGYWDGVPVAFESILPMPSGTMKGAWREHRLVVLCDHQGLGLGSGMSEGIGELVRSWGGRFFSKTANMKLGEYRQTSPRWRATSKNKINRMDFLRWDNNWSPCKKELAHRICYSHEYVGDCNEHLCG
jgi:hypothetical protein